MSAILELNGLAKRFPVRDGLGRARGAVHAVDGVTLSVERGEVLAIVGESGCGKSTLGRLALRLLEPDDGAVQFMGEDLGALPPKGGSVCGYRAVRPIANRWF
jgi:ABC-type oligopeptide transport system ATPase subunit